ncbi:hypothetical protein [Seleniivibrio woodruffii]|uniref:Uncharacterized protein n=1 Tax=Seleniivibrio woodruffii TaxID=1078050 RepID=A0A4R1K2Y4_9BACT|nr:hypothetical protein [Seleniivibrio woodruffii]TCK58426.1 hypothetical protein C8D98_2628 [Seleniivibrio woodruffii]TVZ36799.1 hypothetical protein OF66_2437 [Seleniivibrio woodruffii]
MNKTIQSFQIIPHIKIFVIIFVILFMATPMGLFVNTKISIDTIFSGFLALVGFLFTARTFITFKLHEVIYGNPAYQQHVKQAQEEGAYKKELYDPLKTLDSDLAKITLFSLVAVVIFFLFSFFQTMPKGFNNLYLYEMIGDKTFYQQVGCFKAIEIQLISTFAFSYFFVTFYAILKALKSINSNIQDIIDHWEKQSKA